MEENHHGLEAKRNVHEQIWRLAAPLPGGSNVHNGEEDDSFEYADELQSGRSWIDQAGGGSTTPQIEDEEFELAIVREPNGEEVRWQHRDAQSQPRRTSNVRALQDVQIARRHPKADRQEGDEKGSAKLEPHEDDDAQSSASLHLQPTQWASLSVSIAPSRQCA